MAVPYKVEIAVIIAMGAAQTKQSYHKKAEKGTSLIFMFFH
jgi:hypothetical protein